MSSYNNDMVLRYDGTSGAFIDVFVSSGSGGLDGPSDTRFRNGTFVVVSARSDAVLRYDETTGDFIGSLITPGSGGLDYPHYMQIDENGVLYLAGKHNDNVLKYDADTGQFLGVLVPSGRGGLRGPRGLLILPAPPGPCDANGDGVVNALDIEPFISCLFGT